MPVVEVKVWEGIDAEKKERIIKGVTKVFEELGILAMAVTIAIHEIPKANLGIGGESAPKFK